MDNIKIIINKFKSKNAVVNVNIDFGNGLTLSFVELIKTKDGKEFLTHSSNKQVDGNWKTTYHSYMTEDFQKALISKINDHLQQTAQPTTGF